MLAGWLVAWDLCQCMLVHFSVVLHGEGSKRLAPPRNTKHQMMHNATLSYREMTSPLRRNISAFPRCTVDDSSCFAQRFQASTQMHPRECGHSQLRCR